MILQYEPTTIALDAQTAESHPALQAALEQLSRAACYAVDADRSPWDFAVELESLTDAGLTTSDLRWLVSKGYLEHAVEITRSGDARRQFRPCGHLGFGKRTCFVLTSQGARLVAAPRLGVAKTILEELSAEDELASAEEVSALVPSWDRRRRILRVGARTVKKYRVPSVCQEAVLAAFEEEGWPPVIDDPLRPSPEQDCKRRLRDTISSLNSHQLNAIVRFRGDGSGARILWELTVPAEEPAEELPSLRVRADVRAA
jgi:hypothetical protein